MRIFQLQSNCKTSVNDFIKSQNNRKNKCKAACKSQEGEDHCNALTLNENVICKVGG